MLVLLVRHGHADAKRQWVGDDSGRPLNGQGLAEARALVRVLAPFAAVRIVSSPFQRCLQSMTPLADALGTSVQSSPSLLPDAGVAAANLALNVSFNGAGSVVLCTHGEIIHDMQARLGVEGISNFNVDSPREKASVWVLERIDRRFVSASYIAPPVLQPSDLDP
jgi:phosphohistidine phosphatase SixA